jgi:dienelactone hydrolase
LIDSPWETLFDGSHMELYLRRAPGSGTLCVTFDQMGSPHRPPSVTATTLTAQAGVSHAHVVTKEDDWYQNKDALRVFSAVRALGGGFDEVVTYGASMGGYGAMLAAGYVAPTRVVAVVPQFSIDPAKIPFDPRGPFRPAASSSSTMT